MEDAFRVMMEHAGEFFKGLGEDITHSGLEQLIKMYPGQTFAIIIIICFVLLLARRKNKHS